MEMTIVSLPTPKDGGKPDLAWITWRQELGIRGKVEVGWKLHLGPEVLVTAGVKACGILGTILSRLPRFQWGQVEKFLPNKQIYDSAVS